MRTKLGIMIAIAVASLAWVGFLEAMAHPDTFNDSNPNPARTSATANPGLAFVGGSTVVEICTDSLSRTITPVALISPIPSSPVFTSTHGPVTLDEFECHKFFVGNGAFPTDYLGLPALPAAGSYVALYDSSLGSPFVVEFAVTFFVIPESMIGTIALIGSSLGAFGGYMFLRQRAVKL